MGNKEVDISYGQNAITLLTDIIDAAEGLLDPLGEYITVPVNPENITEKTGPEIWLLVQELCDENLIVLASGHTPDRPVKFTFYKTYVYETMMPVPSYYELKVTDIQGLRNKLHTLIETQNNRLVRYDKQDGKLILENAAVPVRPNSQMSNLLETLIKYKGQILANDEVLEEWGYQDHELTKPNLTKVFDAARNLNGKISQHTSASDFIYHTKHEAGINQKYL